MRKFSEVNYYTVLGVRSSASREEIKAAYRLNVRTAHPDVGGDPDAFSLIAEAWDVLGNESEREHYDADRKLRARASRRYTARIDRDPATGSWSTEGAAPPADDAADADGDGTTDAQRWMQNKRRL